MGCGQSSLKGEKTDDIQSQPSQPVKKTATNFSTVDYETPNNKERRNTEYAPHDEVRQRPSEALSPLTEKKSNPIDKDAITQPSSSAQPGTAAGETNFENKLPDQNPTNPVGGEIAAKEPYKDITTSSPTSPVATNTASALPEGSKPTQ